MSRFGIRVSAVPGMIYVGDVDDPVDSGVDNKTPGALKAIDVEQMDDVYDWDE